MFTNFPEVFVHLKVLFTTKKVEKLRFAMLGKLVFIIFQVMIFRIKFLINKTPRQGLLFENIWVEAKQTLFDINFIYFHHIKVFADKKEFQYFIKYNKEYNWWMKIFSQKMYYQLKGKGNNIFIRIMKCMLKLNCLYFLFNFYNFILLKC